MSPFTAKVRGYLHHKNLLFEEVTPSFVGYHFKIKRKVGRYLIPVIYHPELGVLQDSYDIITTLETHHGGSGVIPTTPKQHFFCRLLEAFADVWLIPTAMHTRWNTTEENRVRTKSDFGRLLCPGFPQVLQNEVGNRVGDSMKAYLPIFGITNNTSPGFEEFIRYWLASLENHLSSSPFLFGERASLADFAVMGPIYAHIWYDKLTGWSEIVEQHTNVMRWMHETNGNSEYFSSGGSQQSAAGWLPNDEIPTTLLPLMKPIVEDFIPYMDECVTSINNYCSLNRHAKRVPRSLGWTDFTVFGYQGRRKLITFDQWKIQSPLSVLEGCGEGERIEIEQLLRRVGAPQGLLHVPVDNPLARKNYSEILKSSL